MSGRLVGAVQEYSLRNVRWKPGKVLTGVAVLSVIAEHADDSGGPAWPSQQTLVRRSRRSLRTVRRMLADLEQVGELVGEHRQGQVSRWHVRPGGRSPADCYADMDRSNPGRNADRGTPATILTHPPATILTGVGEPATPATMVAAPPASMLTAHPGHNGDPLTASEPPTNRQPRGVRDAFVEIYQREPKGMLPYLDRRAGAHTLDRLVAAMRMTPFGGGDYLRRLDINLAKAPKGESSNERLAATYDLDLNSPANRRLLEERA